MAAFPRHLPPTVPTQFTQGTQGFCPPSVNLTNCNQPDNPYTQCLKAETNLFQRIAQDPMFQMRKFPSRYWQLKNLPFDEMPPDALRLNAPTSAPYGLPIASVAVAGEYYTVMQYLVPAGYDGVINVTYNRFVPSAGGSGWQDGSGQLVWALGINNALAVNYTNIGISMGSAAVLGPVTKGGGIRVKANDLIQWLVSAPTGTGGLDAGGILVAGIQGWLYPNR